MPVTARLSSKFYETFGDQIANELVEWFNSVDAAYRANLRELNESNYTRFDSRLAEFSTTWEGRFTAFDAKLEQRLAERLAALETRLVRWMVGLWVTSLLTMIALTLR